MPTNFRIRVVYENKTYEVNVTRTSPGVHSNTYSASIVSLEEVSNRFPPVIYTSAGSQLLYEDNLSKIFPGFAEMQKKTIIDYLELNNIEI